MEVASRTLELLKECQNGNDSAIEEIFLLNQGLVTSLVKRYHLRQNEYDEVKSCANYGLLKAIKNFDFKFSSSFSTYAVPLILGEIRKYFKEVSIVKISRNNKERYMKINKAKEELESNLGRSPTLEELAAYLDEDESDVIDSINANQYVSYLDETIDEDISKIENVKDDSLHFASKVELDLAMEKLTKKEQLVINLRYFQGLSQMEIAKRLYLTQVQICRIEKGAIAKLQKDLV